MHLGLSLGLGGGGGGLSPAAAMLAASLNGIAVDFTDAADDRRVATRNAGALTRSGVDAFLTNAQNMVTPVTVRDASGAWVWSPHNLFLNSETPATQTIGATYTISGATYTISVTGSGSITLSDAHAAVVTEANSPYTFTAASGSLVCTKAGTVTRVQVNRGSTLTAYLAAGAAPVFASPVTYPKGGAASGSPYLVIEPTADQQLDNTSSPATQTKSLAAGTYTLWCEGSGSVELSGGPTGTATEDNPVTFTLDATTSVTFTVAGTLSRFNCTNTAGVTSYMETFTAPVRRWQADVQVATSAIPGFGVNHALYFDFMAEGDLSNAYVGGLEDSSTNYIGVRLDPGGVLISRVLTGGSAVFSAQMTNAAPANARHSHTIAMRSDMIRCSLDGSPFGQGGINIAPITTPTPTKLRLGRMAAQSAPAQVIRVYRVAVLSEDLPSDRVSQRFYTFDTDATPYHVFALAGQSNVYSGATLDAGIDVSGGHTWQIGASTGTLENGAEPLNHPVPIDTSIGFGVAFSRVSYQPATGAEVLLLPMGVANTGYFDNRWNPGDDLYERLLNLIGLTMARFPNASLKAVMWMQGEREAEQGWTQAQYRTAWLAMAAGIRARFADVPFIVGSMVPPYVAANATWQPVQDALEDMPNQLSGVAFADATGLGISTDVHYSAADHRSYGARWYTAWQTL